MLLTEEDPAPFEILNPHGSSPFFLTCEHAGNAVPERLENLGITQADLNKHYALDRGAETLVRHLSFLLDAPAILGKYCRLVIDVNRPLDHLTLIANHGEGMPVPGNLSLTKEEIDARIKEVYEPYHLAASQQLDFMSEKHDNRIALISLHSFTGKFYNYVRPWEITFLWVQDDRLARHGTRYFQNLGYTSDDNVPYDIQKLGPCFTTLHGDSRRIPNVYVEYLDELIEDGANGRHWANMTANMLRNYAARDDAFAPYEGPEHIFDPAEEKTYISNLIEKAKQGEQG